jgi:hypothetical protein
MSLSIQEQWEAVFNQIGRSCPPPLANEAQVDYLRRLSIIGKRYLPNDEQVKRVTFKRLPDDVVEQYSSMVKEAVERSIWRTDNMSSGELRAVPQPGPNGSRTTLFVGPDSFCKALTTPARRVVSFSAPQREILYQNRSYLKGLFGG